MLRVKEHPEITIYDTRWDNGERDIVIARPDAVPPLPKPLSALLGRKRAGVYEHGESLRMSVCLVRPDGNGWPRASWCRSWELVAECGHEILDALYELGVIRIDDCETVLGDDSRQRKRLCALLGPDAEAAPIALYVVTRVLPTLRHVKWLP
ncbi:hypothetical protein WDH52_18435 [Streptomyces sp. TRM70308]|uniref:hypothetical protein n=1 Tax=Streptomyces sp. TRM70308 TaxID=3131932 RepID=UPI003D00B640